MVDDHDRRQRPVSLLGRIFRESLGAAREISRHSEGRKHSAIEVYAAGASDIFAKSEPEQINPTNEMSSYSIDGSKDARPLLDVNQRAMLEGEFGFALLAELTVQFRADAIELVEQIETAADTADVVTLRVAAHTLRGAAENLGCTSLARAVVDLKDRYVEFGPRAAMMNRQDLRLLLAETLLALEPTPK